MLDGFDLAVLVSSQQKVKIRDPRESNMLGQHYKVQWKSC